MDLHETRRTTPKPLNGMPPWHPESYSDMVDLSIRDLPFTYELYPEFAGWNFLFSVRIGDDETNRRKIKQLLLDQFEKNPATGFLAFKGEPGINIMIWEKLPMEVDG